MEIKKGPLHKEFHNGTYWARVYFKLKDRESKLLICGSEEYFNDNDIKPEVWYQNVVEKWKAFGDKIFKKEVHYDVYAISDKGKINGLDFLQNKIKP